ncbi:MAG: polymer-forming cytoskeletal protein [Treponema sp.]|jgi:cytoskeletal protein CcmA (bactofilin family)|nr:polymer-forming cytoskeletal protein [Treponema sp.]
MAAHKHEDFSINSILGPNTSVNGDIESGGFTRVDGSLRGNLRVKGRVVVGEKARIKGSIAGTVITVGGVVYGNILAGERLIILSTGLVLGDIITRRIEADEGCLIHGQVKVCRSDEQWNQALTEYQDAQGVRSALSGFSFRSDKSHGQG